MKIDVLDHGYVELIEAWGTGRDGRGHTFESDGVTYEAVGDRDHEVGLIEAARQSTQGTFRGWDAVDESGASDARLLRRLYSNDPKHATPFEFAGMVLEVQAPIGVFREWHRHRTQSYNEMSARYAPLPDLYYVPSLDETHYRVLAATKTANRQAGTIPGAGVADRVAIAEWLDDLERSYADAERLYQKALRVGIPKELARWSMPVGHYSRMRAAANLRNWFAFLTLRTDSKAMHEIRAFARAVERIAAATFPRTHALWLAERITSEQN